MKIKLGKDERAGLNILLRIASQLDDRPILQCVRVEAEPGLMRFVTVDGYRIAGMEVEADGEETFGANFFANMVEQLLKRGRGGELTISAESIIEEGSGMSVSAASVRRSYPNWRAIVPDGEYCDSHLTVFTFRFLDTLVKLYSGSGPGRDTLVFLNSINSGPDTPHAWAWKRGKANYLYVLMPMHTSNPPELLPIEHWIRGGNTGEGEEASDELCSVPRDRTAVINDGGASETNGDLQGEG